MPTFFGGTGTTGVSLGQNNVYFQPSTCTLSGNVTDGQVYYVSGSGNIKMAVYSDSGGLPGTKLGESSTLALSGSAGWQAVTFGSPFAVTNGVTYWIAWNMTGFLNMGSTSGVGPVFRYVGSAYPAFPATATGTTASAAYNLGMQVGVTATATTPVADFTGTPLTGAYTLSVAFTDTSTNTPTSWAWTFGDGGTSTAQNPSHSYTAAGTYTVTLVATNAAGSDTETKTGYVVVGSPVTAPVADFSASPLSGDRPLTVVFADLSA